MTRSHSWTRAAAVVAVAAVALAGCSTNSDSGSGAGDTASASGGSTDPLKVGGLMPLTGSLAYLAPSEVAAAKLALQDINDAGGVLGKDAEYKESDSSDADHAETNTSAAQELISWGADVIIGAPSSAVTKNVLKDITSTPIVQISQGNTATDLSGVSPYYFRTVPPDTAQGAALGNVIAGDLGQGGKLAILPMNEDYATSLRDVVEETVEGAGVEVTYGKKGQEFQPTESDFATLASTVAATQPDAVLVIAFEQTKQIIPALSKAGVDTHKLYFTDGNTADYSETFEPGTLEGSQGTIPGAAGPDVADFRERLTGVDSSLKDFTYGAETYDAIILAALAAEKGGSTDPSVIKDNMASVSGADGGTECATFKDCVDALKDGDIHYQPASGIGPFNKNNDPSTANIGVYKFDAKNAPQFVKAQEGQVPE